MLLNPVGDTVRLKKYYIDSVIIYPDFTAADITNSAPYTEEYQGGYIIRYHKKLFRNSLLIRNMGINKGEVYSQGNYAKTISNFSKSGVWQNTNIQIDEMKDSAGKIKMIVQLLPAKKFGFEANIEASYSANSNTNSASIANAGNLLGLSTNFSLQNRNVGKSGTKMTHAIRAGVELNLNAQQGSNRRVNSNELSYTNTISFPRLLGPIRLFYPNKKQLSRQKLFDVIPLRSGIDSAGYFLSQQTFINVVPAYSNRINLFNQLSLGVAFGNEYTRSRHPNRKNLFKFLNIEYSYLYNQSDSFKKTLELNPYLRYSFNTALVIGLLNYGYSSTYINPKKLNHLRSFRWNIEESGLLLGRFGLFKKELRQFIKTDVEYTFVVEKPKSSRVFRVFAGVGIPIGKGDSILPFFKQYFAGGANSMRAWPIRGVGPGSYIDTTFKGVPFQAGDMKLEFNSEFRFPLIWRLESAIFLDAGNIWDIKESFTGAKFSNTWFKELAIGTGVGMRLDVSYAVIRLDFGYKLHTPYPLENNQSQWIGLTSFKWGNFNTNFALGLPF